MIFERLSYPQSNTKMISPAAAIFCPLLIPTLRKRLKATQALAEIIFHALPKISGCATRSSLLSCYRTLPTLDNLICIISEFLQKSYLFNLTAKIDKVLKPVRKERKFYQIIFSYLNRY